jgi:excisionase family DNA binding protein
MADRLLTVPQVAEEFQVTSQTIRNWIDSGVVPAIRVGRGFRIKRGDVDELLERAAAESKSAAARSGVWTPNGARLSARDGGGEVNRTIWDGGGLAVSVPET